MNGNLRIIFDNAADRGSLIASSQVGSLVATNLRTEKKAQVWRSASTTASLSLTWNEYEPIGGIILGFNNFTSQALVRARGWEDLTSPFPDFDTGQLLCQPVPSLKYLNFLNPLGENAYTPGGASLLAFGHGSYGALWINDYFAAKRLQIDISDPGNSAGYLEFSRLIVGRYWEPLYNFDFGNGVSYVDGGKTTRSEAGDSRSEQGARWRKISLALSYMDAIDRTNFLRIARMHGTTKPFFISAYPRNEDSNLEQVFQLWGKFADNPKISIPRYDAFATQIEIEEM